MTITKKAPKRAAETGAKFSTREEWLNAAAKAIRILFDEIGAAEYPRFRVSCGFPKGGRKAIGQAWSAKASGDATAEVFISPKLEQLAEVGKAGVLDVLLHEMIHVIDRNENGHKGPFRKMAKALGLEGKMTETVPSEALVNRLLELTSQLGTYPHAQLSSLTIAKQTTRMLRIQCPACGFICRTTQKWLDEVGPPTCGCGTVMQGPNA